jgi:rhomboid protease GluP
MLQPSITLIGVENLALRKEDNRVRTGPSMCRNCGAIVGAGQTQCSVCGAPTAAPGASQRPQVVSDRETIRFARAILARPYIFTIVLLMANIFIYMLMWQSSGLRLSLLEPFPREVLEAYGAKLNFLINSQHQWWRLITPMFVHVNLLHLLVNMYSLWILGPYVEKLYGSAKFIVFWVLTGLGASVASYMTVTDTIPPLGPLGRFLFRPDLPSAGASGSLFGLVGILFAFGIRYRRELPEGFKRAFGTGLLPMILLNLFIGYVGSGIFDNAAHLGGLISGALLGFVVGYRRPGEKPNVAIVWRVLQILAVAVVVFSFVKVAQHFPAEITASSAPTPVQNQNGTAVNFVIFSRAMNEAQEAFVEAVQGNTEPVEPAIKGLDSAPHLDPQADELKETLKGLLTDARNLKSPPVTEEEQKPDSTRLKDLRDSFVAWSKAYNHWLSTTGKTYSGLKDLTIQQDNGNNPRK